MVAESEMIEHPDCVGLVARVVVLEVLQHPHLHEGLLVEARLVTNHLDGYQTPLLVIVRLDHLPKGTLARYPQYLIAPREMVMEGEEVVTALVVIAVVHLCWHEGRAGFGSRVTIPPDTLDPAHLGTFVFRERVVCHGEDLVTVKARPMGEDPAAVAAVPAFARREGGGARAAADVTAAVGSAIGWIGWMGWMVTEATRN